MIFPIGDEQVKGGFKPIFSYAFIVINVLFFLFQLSVEGNMICQWGSIPREIVQGQDTFTLFTSMFMHAGCMNLIGNMLFLWVFADNIEATIGYLNFLIFYLLGGIAASALHIFFSVRTPELAGCYSPCQASAVYHQGMAICEGMTPSVGASGSISAVLGAYLVMFPKSKIKIFVVYIFRNFHVPAFIFLGLWIGQQLLSGFMSLGQAAQSSGVAWWAHIGGFAFGVLAGLFINKILLKQDAHSEYL